MTEAPHFALLHGNDEFAISAQIDKLCEGMGDATTADMNIARFDGRTGLDREGLNTALNAMPFLAPRRVVVLLHPLAVMNSAEARKKMQSMLEKAPPTTTLVLAEFEELKGEKKSEHWLVKWIKQADPQAAVHIYSLPKHMEMPRWIQSEAKKLGGGIEPNAAGRLADMVGEDTRIASQELNKLLAYVNYARPIGMVDVERVSVTSAQGSVFELVDALGQRNGRTAQHVLHQLLTDADAAEFWGMIIRQFRLLLQARELLDEHAGVEQIRSTLGLHEFVAQKVTSQARQFSMPSLETIYHKLLDIDARVKTSQIDLDVALDTLIMELAR